MDEGNLVLGRMQTVNLRLTMEQMHKEQESLQHSNEALQLAELLSTSQTKTILSSLDGA